MTLSAEDYRLTRLPNSFIDGALQICIVTHDLDRAVKDYADRLGIGPWWINDARPPEMKDARINGVPTSFTMRLALAWTGSMMWEIIQPLSGPTVYQRFLDQHGDGVQHVAVSYKGRAFDECVAEFRRRGFPPIQECKWNGVRVCYFDTLGAARTTFEIFDWPDDMVLPEPERWYPPKP